MAGDVSSSWRSVHTSGRRTTLIFIGGGPDKGDDELTATAEAFIAVARRLVPSIAYAHVRFVEPGWNTAAPATRVRSAESIVEPRADEFGGGWLRYQILGPGHLRLLGDAIKDPPPPAVVHQLDGGMGGALRRRHCLLDPQEPSMDRVAGPGKAAAREVHSIGLILPGMDTHGVASGA